MHKSFTDQMGRAISIVYPPKRIVSLVPSQSELLADLGLTDEVIGITKFCIHPAGKFASCTKIGGTKKLRIDKIRELKPDLIIGNKEENLKSDIEILEQEFPVWMSDINNLEEAVEAIRMIGELVDRQPEASYLNHLITAGFKDLEFLAAKYRQRKKVAYLIWKDPYMAAGKGTFIDDILHKTGLENAVKEERYPETGLMQLAENGCDYIFLSSEPYPFKEKHISAIEENCPGISVQLVDGEMFSWYGSRLVKAILYLFTLQKQVAENF